MASLYKTKSRYIRCIKPNTKKAPSLMEHKPTIEQLQCAGVVAGITIARSSFPNSLPNSVILARYSNLWDTDRFPSKRTPNMTVQQKRQCDCDALMQSALESLEVRDENGNLKKAYAVGKTKTYFRAGALELLEAGRCSGFDDQATIIQRAARAWLSRNCGQSRKSREAKEMEEKMRRAARLAEAERLAKIAAENEARRNSRRQALSKLMDEAAALGVAQSRLESDYQRNMDAADGTKRAARQELERMRGQFLTKERAVAERNAAVLAEQEKKIEEAKKLINYLKKENHKEAKKRAKAAAALETARNNNKKLQGGVDSICDGLDNEGKRNDSANSSRAKLMNTLLETKQTNKDLMDELAQMQAKYLKQAQARLRLQKAMAGALKAIQEKSNNKDIIEDTIIEALKAENAGKAVMARLDVETMFPDLMLSDLSGSSDTDSD
jgi:myosin heavy subunit